MDTDIVIVGAGPAGLCLARALTGQRLTITVVEAQEHAVLAAPAFDGREIALTHPSVELLKTLDVWPRIEEHAKSPLRVARVFDGSSPRAMEIGRGADVTAPLGWLTSNHLIRRAAYEAVQVAADASGEITLLSGSQVCAIDTDAAAARVMLVDGTQLRARLVIAADSRFSLCRRMMGIAADQHDFGKTMLVCCMEHSKSHDHAAWEWFGYGQTLALLPMNPAPGSNASRSSVVITLPSQGSEALAQLAPDDFEQDVTRRFAGRLGPMRLVSSRHCYPLVSVQPRQLVAERFALAGDAALGMHPVTAHGFNFGLFGVATLSRTISAAHRQGHDIAGRALLHDYASAYRRHTQPLYWATRLITDLYTRDTAPARLARRALLRLGCELTPFKRALAASLTGR